MSCKNVFCNVTEENKVYMSETDLCFMGVNSAIRFMKKAHVNWRNVWCFILPKHVFFFSAQNCLPDPSSESRRLFEYVSGMSRGTFHHL